jgi:hypothetical protein
MALHDLEQNFAHPRFRSASRAVKNSLQHWHLTWIVLPRITPCLSRSLRLLPTPLRVGWCQTPQRYQKYLEEQTEPLAHTIFFL